MLETQGFKFCPSHHWGRAQFCVRPTEMDPLAELPRGPRGRGFHHRGWQEERGQPGDAGQQQIQQRRHWLACRYGSVAHIFCKAENY